MGIGNLGLAEMVILAVLVLVFFGPRRLPEVARTVGAAMREFRRGVNEIRRELEVMEESVTREEDDRAGSGGRRPTGRLVPPGAGSEGGTSESDEEGGPEADDTAAGADPAAGAARPDPAEGSPTPEGPRGPGGPRGPEAGPS